MRRRRKVNLEYPLAVARLTRLRGARSFALNPAVGVIPNSRTFCNRVKGEAEQALRGCGFTSLTIARPALLAASTRRRRSRAHHRIRRHPSAPPL